MLIPFSSLVVGERLRKDYQNVTQLADSIANVGLIHPPAVRCNADGTYSLIAGGRRYAAIALLRERDPSLFAKLPVHVMFDAEADASRARCMEAELEENLQRSSMHWHEYVTGIATLHELKQRSAREADESWTTAMTGQLFNQSHTSVRNALVIAKALRAGDKEILACENASAALAILTTRRLRAAEIEQEKRRKAALDARQQQRAVAVVSSEPSIGTPVSSSPNVPVDDAKLDRYEEACRRFIHADSLVFASGKESFYDGIYCDPPYGIDVNNLNLKQIDVTAAQHDRDENIALFRPFLEAVWRMLKPESYAVLWCDPEHFTTHLRDAKDIGFRVMRWPLIACKPLGKNEAAAYNVTKDCEFAFVVAKAGATLATRRSSQLVPWAWRTGEAARYVHPFAKPFSAHSHILQTFWPRGARILDMCCGEGSSVLAGLELGYDMTGVDIVEAHIQRARRHYEAATL